MKAVLTTLLIGAAVAGVVYYFRDNENVRKVLDDVKDKANDAYGRVSESIRNTVNQGSDAVASRV